MKKILILGDTGMLGSMITTYFNRIEGVDLFGTYNSVSYSDLFAKGIKETFFNPLIDSSINTILKESEPDYIINCIGVIKPYCNTSDSDSVRNAILINSLFPHELSKQVARFNSQTRIIQIATDCVYDGKRGRYTENDEHNPTDVYGKTKSLGEVESDNMLNIRCSIVGPEVRNRLSLMEWFLSHQDGEMVNGYINHLWNGVTTLQFAQFCNYLLKDEALESSMSKGNPIHLVKNTDISKYDLLLLFNETFDRNINVKPVECIDMVDRRLRSLRYNCTLKPMKEAVYELGSFITEMNYYGKK